MRFKRLWIRRGVQVWFCRAGFCFRAVQLAVRRVGFHSVRCPVRLDFQNVKYRNSIGTLTMLKKTVVRVERKSTKLPGAALRILKGA